jgi:hypothetical protein
MKLETFEFLIEQKIEMNVHIVCLGSDLGSYPLIVNFCYQVWLFVLLSSLFQAALYFDWLSLATF